MISSKETVTDLQKKYAIPFILITSLFFLWGLANILNSALIAHFQPVFEITRAQALLVETAFYLGYFTIAIPAGLFMQKFSYKKGILLGLFLYAAGALLFIPAAKSLTFGFFLVALYIIASGLAFLETAANPYVTILGKPETASQRLNLAQSFNGLALVVGPLLAGMLIFSSNDGNLTTEVAKQEAADAVILPYAGIAVAVLLVAFLLYITKMPEPEKSENLKFDSSIFKHKHLVRGFITQLLYVGAQVGIWGITIDLVVELLPEIDMKTASKYFLLAGTILFVIGRFVGTFILSYVKDNRLLGIYAICAVILCIIGGLTEGEIAVHSIVATNFFMSIMFPTIFSLSVKDLGKHTKLGSSLIIMGIVGGAIIPPFMGLVADHSIIQNAFFIPAICFLVVAYFGFKGYVTKKI